jgi:hypothetical protein
MNALSVDFRVVEDQGTQVIVHLGKLPRYVTHYASMAAAMLPLFDTVLICDTTSLPKVPGVRVLSARDCVTLTSQAQIDAALSALGIDPDWRDGYWRRIFLRFALVEAVMLSVDRRGAALQLESDILSSLSPHLVAQILLQIDDRCYMPFIDDETAGPGIMIASSPDGLSRACRFVLDALESGLTSSDMAALAMARDTGVVAALPSRASESPFAIRTLSDEEAPLTRIVFDAAATGQYLCGIDPRNNRGVLKPGYLETRGGLDPGEWRDWRIVNCDDGIARVACTMESGTGVFANIHMHAKLSLTTPSISDPSWNSILRVANGVESPKSRVDFRAMR